MATITVTAATFEEEVLKSNQVVLVDFWASWCGPCNMLSPLVEQVSEEHEEIKVCKINVDEEPDLAEQYKVMSIPMLLVFKNGEIARKSVGVISKTEIENLIQL